MKRNRGMTMIELIVVIAIIGILVALLFPAIDKIREQARRVTCRSNLHQLHVACISYANDHGGELPRAATEEVIVIYPGEEDEDSYEHIGYQRGWLDWYRDDTDPKTYWWGNKGIYCITNGTLFPYLGDAGDEKIYVCPSFVRYVRREGALNSGSVVKVNAVRSYGMNPECSARNFYRISGPTRRILFGEQGFWKNPRGSSYKYGLQSISTADRWDDPPPDPVAGTYTRRYWRNLDGCIDYKRGSDSRCEHLGSYHSKRGQKGHCVFLDGHVELVDWKVAHLVCTGNWGE